MGEVFAWPEARFFFGSAGESPAAMAYVERVSFQARYDWRRYRNLSTGAWAARSTYVLADKLISIEWGQMWVDSTALLRANSATAWNFAISASALGQTGAIQVWSAVFRSFELAGQADGLFRINGSLEASDYSAL